jgi:hypothetical protein
MVNAVRHPMLDKLRSAWWRPTLYVYLHAGGVVLISSLFLAGTLAEEDPNTPNVNIDAAVANLHLFALGVPWAFAIPEGGWVGPGDVGKAFAVVCCAVVNVGLHWAGVD